MCRLMWAVNNHNAAMHTCCYIKSYKRTAYKNLAFPSVTDIQMQNEMQSSCLALRHSAIINMFTHSDSEPNTVGEYNVINFTSSFHLSSYQENMIYCFSLVPTPTSDTCFMPLLLTCCDLGPVLRMHLASVSH